MFSNSEKFSTAFKTQSEAQLAMINAVATKALESIAKVVELSVTAAKASATESAEIAQQLLAAKDPQAFFTLAAAQTQPAAEKALSFGRHLSSIASDAQADFTKGAEAQIAETSGKITALIDEVTKNAPAGSESAVAMVKSAMGNASAGYEQLTKTTKQAVEKLEASLSDVTKQFSQAVEKAVSPAAMK